MNETQVSKIHGGVDAGLSDVGNTPLRCVRSVEVGSNRVYAKCELMNPTGSHKDRTFLYMISQLETMGRIRPGMTLVDCSTGNGGAALAWVGREKGYKVKVFMPEGMTDERKSQIRSFGAEIVETDRHKFLNGSVEAASRYVAERDPAEVYFLDQGTSELNTAAWTPCGQEIVNELQQLKVVPDYFVCAIGTGGTFSGIAKVLKAEFPDIRTIGIEVDKSAPLFAKRHKLDFAHQPHNMMGLGAGVLSPNTNEVLVDEVVTVDGDRSWRRMKAFIEEEGIEIGPTCGANLLVCENVARGVSDKVFVTLFFDSAWKYRSRWSGVYPEYRDLRDTSDVTP